MHPIYMIVLILFLLPCLNVLSLLLLGVFWPLPAPLAFLELFTTCLLYDLKPQYQKIA